MGQISSDDAARIKKKLRDNGVDPDTIDWKAEWDSEVDFDANWENLKEVYGLKDRKRQYEYEDDKAQVQEYNLQVSKERQDDKKKREREGRSGQLFGNKGQTTAGREKILMRKQYTPVKEVVVPDGMFQGRPVKKDYGKAARSALSFLGGVGRGVSHFATHDLAPASSKVLVKNQREVIVQRLKKEVRPGDIRIGNYKEIYGPIPNAAYGNRKRFLMKRYSNPLGQPSSLFGKIYAPRAISKVQFGEKKRKKKMKMKTLTSKVGEIFF